jgi:adenylosuccinate lyase
VLNSALEIEMKPIGGEVYRVAFDSANSELNDILGAYEELRARKDRIEKVVMALKPLLGAEEAAAAAAAVQSASDAANEAVQSQEEPAYQYQATNGNGASSDPFARRLDSALGHGAGRKFSTKF